MLVENVRFLAGDRRSRLVDEAPLNHAFARAVDGEPLGMTRLTGNGPVWRVQPTLLALVWLIGAVIGGHLIPVIWRPTCSMRSISGLPTVAGPL